MQLTRRRLVHAGLSLAIGLVVVGGIWAGIYWARYPKAPDVAKAPLDQVIHFTASDEFNRMAEWHRKRYLLAIVGRMNELSFPDLLSMMMTADPDRRKQMENMNRLPEADKKEIGGAWMRLFLDKFFSLPKTDRDTYLTLLALAEKAGRSHGPSDKKPGMPTPDQIQKGMTEFMSQQPPHAAAQMDELMLEMSKKRQMLGMKGPWG